ncbi:MAG TPA: hypothetical protein PKH77_11390 [Anaerolineae bacterium]|nr:hypothetical protein [Anaerolineae bacterium]
MKDKLIALFAFEQTEVSVAVVAEKHYCLVSPEMPALEELESYQRRPE